MPPAPIFRSLIEVSLTATITRPQHWLTVKIITRRGGARGLPLGFNGVAVPGGFITQLTRRTGGEAESPCAPADCRP